jgi:hypothetical protein
MGKWENGKKSLGGYLSEGAGLSLLCRAGNDTGARDGKCEMTKTHVHTKRITEERKSGQKEALP